MTADVHPSLTIRQRRVLEYVRQHVADHGYGPSFRDIAAATGLRSVSSVTYQLDRLEVMGWICRRATVPRSIVVLDPIGEAA